MKKFAKIICVAAFAATCMAGTAHAQTVIPASPPPPGMGPDTVQAGVLECDISAGIGLIVTSKKEVTCLFKPVNNAPQEVYVGSITKFGLDLGATGPGQMIWTVYAPTSRAFGALAGIYGGAAADASVVVGVGANVLFGGSNRTIALQPLSVQGQVGLNVAVGVAELKLRTVQ